MELLSQGAMVERFERKKMAVKSKLNELVDDLFAFMLSEVTTIVPPALHPVMATSGGATITVVPSPSSSSSTLLPPTSKSSTPAASAPPSGSGTISAPSSAAAGVNNAVIGNGLGATTFTMLKPVSKPATAHLAMKVKEEIREEEDFEEEDEDDEEDEYDDEDEDDDHHHQHRTTNIGRASLGILSKAALSLSQRSQSATRSQQQLQSAAAGSSGHSNQGNHGSNHHHHHHHHHHNHNHRNHPNSSGFCDSDDDSCECYDCMDESMVKVEMEMENDDSDSDNLGKHFYASSEGGVGPKRKRQKTFAERRAASGGTGAAGVGAAGSAIADLDSGGGGGPSDINENLDDDDESESVSNNHQIDTLGLQCWLPGCKAMLEDRAKLNQHLYFEHDKTLPYQCRVIGCGRQFDVRKDFWHHIRTGHVDFTCSICSIKFNGYFPFITHEFQQHEEGIFKCSREDCDFVAAIRDLVYKHAKTEHVKFVCTFAGCEATFECYSYLKRHRRIHSQVKPYRCKWPGCGYSSTQCGAVIQHIRIRHFKLPSSVKKQKELNIVDHRNPNDYLQVITELLN